MPERNIREDPRPGDVVEYDDVGDRMEVIAVRRGFVFVAIGPWKGNEKVRAAHALRIPMDRWPRHVLDGRVRLTDDLDEWHKRMGA